MVSVDVILLTTICNGFGLLPGVGVEFLLHAIKKQHPIKIAHNIFFIVVTFSCRYVTILVLVLLSEIIFPISERNQNESAETYYRCYGVAQPGVKRATCDGPAGSQPSYARVCCRPGITGWRRSFARLQRKLYYWAHA